MFLVDIFFGGEYFSMMGLFLLSLHPKLDAEDEAAARRPFWGMAPIFRKTAIKRPQIIFLIT